jgi:hypothetical protein
MKIAIQGHPTRGKEVIKILKSLGGKNREGLEGYCKTFYYIDDKNVICDDHEENFPSNYKLYTLEEFEKEFPFKIGDEVIFPVKVGWASGKVTGLTYVGDQLKYEVDNRIAGYRYIEPHKLQLYPMKEERNITLTLDKAKEWYNKGGELREIALQAFTEKELNPLPRSWEEFIESIKFTFKGYLEYIDGIVHWSNSCFPNKSIGESSKVCDKHVALFQLEQLRNYWWGDWKPEWDCCEKHVIKWKKDDLIVFMATRVHAFLVFPTKEMAEEFLKCFRDLIEKAGDLI